MKTLFLLRHAKSSWDDPSLTDHDRPLNPRGRGAAPAMGSFMRDGGHEPHLVLCSTATRTRQTLAAVLEQLDVQPAIEWERELYLAGAGQLIERLRAVPDGVASVLMVGHNPGTATVANVLCGSGEQRDLDLMLTKFPTGALAIIDLDIDRWEHLEHDCGRLRSFTRPRDLA